MHHFLALDTLDEAFWLIRKLKALKYPDTQGLPQIKIRVNTEVECLKDEDPDKGQKTDIICGNAPIERIEDHFKNIVQFKNKGFYSVTKIFMIIDTGDLPASLEKYIQSLLYTPHSTI